MEVQDSEQLKEVNPRLRNKMEKDYNPERKNKQMIAETPKKISEIKTPTDNKIISEKNVKDEKILTPKETISEPISEAKLREAKPDDEKKEEKKKPIVKKEIVKKDYAVVNIKNSPVSTKHSMAICKFIKNKKIEDAIEYLEKVIVGKKAIPMKGEIPHRKGKMMSGRFPKNASKEFIMILKSLRANANANNLNEPIISEAIANIGTRPYGRFGRTRKKRTNITIKCRERKEKKE